MMRKPISEKMTPLRPRRWRKAMLLTLAVPPLVVGALGLTAAFRIYAGNHALAEDKRFPAMPAPRVGQRLLVFAPHCDDESLGAAGMMRQSRLAGDDVRVVVITNGDGFRVGVQRDFRELSVPPKDFIRYAYRRQVESRNAMGVLGVPSDHVTFLCYPDRGLMPMWTTNWSSKTPFRSAFTLSDHSPYDDAPTPHAPYSGEALLADIETQMEAGKPSDIYVTHPNDDHPDHAAASVFVQTALADLKTKGVSWAQTCRLHFYLVHRGDWPVPQGLHEGESLPPPAQMADLDTHWQQLPLSVKDRQKKYAAIKRYPSQTEVSSRFLFSFVRRNELFGTLDAGPGLVCVPDNRMKVDGDPQEWRGLTPVALDPSGDSVMRAFQASADITRIFACRDSRMVYVRVDARQHLSSRVSYAITLRPMRAMAAPAPSIEVLMTPHAEGRPQPVPGLPGAFSAWHGSSVEIAVPLTATGLTAAQPNETLFIAAETRFADLTIDRTGFRAIAVNPASPPVLAASR